MSVENRVDFDIRRICEKSSGDSALITSLDVADNLSDVDRSGGKIFSVSDSLLSMINTINIKLKKAEIINRLFLRFIILIL